MSTGSEDDASGSGEWAPPYEDGYTHLSRDEILTCVATSVQNVLSEAEEGQTIPDRYKLSPEDVVSASFEWENLHTFYGVTNVRQEYYISEDDPNVYRTVTYIKINGEWERAGESNWTVHLMPRTEFDRETGQNESQYVVAIKEIWIQSLLKGFRWAQLSHFDTLLIAALLRIAILGKDDCTDLTAFFANFSVDAGSYKVKEATLHNAKDDDSDASFDSYRTSQETPSGSFTEGTDSSSGTQPGYYELYDPCLYARTRDDDPRKFIVTTIQYFLNSAVYSKKKTALNTYLRALLRYNSDLMTIQHYDLAGEHLPKITSDVEQEITKLKNTIVNCLNNLTGDVEGIVNTHFDDVMSNTTDWAPYDHKLKKLVDVSASDPLSITLVPQVLAAYRGEHGGENLHLFLSDVARRLQIIRRTARFVPQQEVIDESHAEASDEDIGVSSDEDIGVSSGVDENTNEFDVKRQKKGPKSGGSKTRARNPDKRNKTKKNKRNKTKKNKNKQNKTKKNKNKKKNKKLNYSAKRK